MPWRRDGDPTPGMLSSVLVSCYGWPFIYLVSYLLIIFFSPEEIQASLLF